MRLIDADALKDAVMETEPVFDTNLNPYQKTHDVMVVIDNAPTVEPKTGRWKRTKAYPNIIFCDECGEPFEQSNSKDKWNYCPNCGADMRGEQDG